MKTCDSRLSGARDVVAWASSYTRLVEALTGHGLSISDAQSLACVILGATKSWSDGQELSNLLCSICAALMTSTFHDTMQLLDE